MNHARLAVVALVAGSLLASGCGSSRHAGSLPGLTAAKLATLTAKARDVAEGDGDAHPSEATIYATVRRESTRAPLLPPPTQPVCVVVLRGHFVCGFCDLPGAAPPRGNDTIVFDRKTLQGLAGGVAKQVDPSALGIRRLGPGRPVALG